MTPRVNFFGECRLFGPDGVRHDLPTRKSWGLLAYLCQITGRGDVRREELAALLWPRANEAQARASLRQELAVLRKALHAAQAGKIDSGRDRVKYTAPAGLVDSIEIEQLLDGRDLGSARRAVALYRGGFLRDLKLRAGPFEEWAWIERQRLKNRVLRAMQDLLGADVAQDNPELVVATAERMLAIEPTQEQAYRALMRIAFRSGHRAEALRLYSRCTDHLRTELDAEPSDETNELARQIREDTSARPDRTERAADRRDLIILCLRLVGVEELADIRDPGSLANAQRRFSELAANAVTAAGGYVLPGLGDQMACVFGFPDRKREDGENALNVALALTGRAVSLTPETDLWPRAGVARGDMLITPGDSGSQEFALVGVALLRAGFLAQSAKGRQVVASSDITNALTEHYEMQPSIFAGDLAGRSSFVVRRAKAG